MSEFAGQSAGWKVISLPRRLFCLFFCATVFGSVYLLLLIGNITQIRLWNCNTLIPWNEVKNVYEVKKNTDSEGFTISTDGCTIPLMNPYDDTVRKFVKYPTLSEVCPNASHSLLDSNRTHIWVKEENRRNFNLSDEDNVTCCFQSFYRPVSIENITSLNNDNRVHYEKCIYFNKTIKVTDEFVRVTCSVHTSEIYKQYYIFAHKKPLSSDSSTMVNNKSTYNVIVMGIDAVSRLNFHRTMPKTLKYLKDNGAIELLGYNKVGDNTFPNLVPMLMGISEQELKTTCIPNTKSSFDNCPLVWEQYKEAGYYTAFGEDSSWLGTCNYARHGFLGYPTDYYIHTFMNEAENNVGSVKDFNSYLCMNDKYFYEVLLGYIKNLSITLCSEKLFGFFWEVSMSHDYLNYPMLIDYNYVNFFSNLEKTKYLDETILLLVSDHGIRWGDIRMTKQGRLEERLPFVYILCPQKFKTDYTEAFNNLKLNARRLTTPYDLHATLADLVDMTKIENKNIIFRKVQFYSRKRGISLFLPIPTNRTCSMADIDDHWCSCRRSISISTDNIEAIEAAEMLVRKINMLIQNYKQCAKLKLTRIIEVNKIVGGTPDDNLKGWQEYMLVIQTTPGNGLFEATLRRYSTEWNLGGISRLNIYGEQSHCVQNSQLKLYCFCLKNLF